MLMNHVNGIFIQSFEHYKNAHPELSENELKSFFHNFFEKIIKDLNEKTEELLREDNFPLEPGKTASKEFVGEFSEGPTKLEFKTLTNEEKTRRLDLQKKAIDAAVDWQISLADHDAYINEKCKNSGVLRNLSAFFGDHFTPENKELSPRKVLDRLMDKNVSSEEKQQLMSDYIDEAAKVVGKRSMKISDEDLIKNFSEIREEANIFTVDHVSDIFEAITGVKLDPAIENKHKTYVKQLGRNCTEIDARMATLTDSLCTIYDEKDAIKFSKVCSEIVYKDLEGITVESLSGEGKVNIISFSELQSSRELYDSRNDNDKYPNFDYIKTINKLDQDTKYFTKNGFIEENTIQDSLKNNAKEFYALKSNGELVHVSPYDAYVQMDNNPITKVENSKEKYGAMLKKLNEGTGLFIRSSKEYKNMRNILGQLAQGKGNELELIEDLNKNIDIYTENFEKKTNKSSTALKRMTCVNAIAEDAKNISLSLAFEKGMSELNLEATNEKETKHQIEIDELKNINNVGIEATNEQELAKENVIEKQEISEKR